MKLTIITPTFNRLKTLKRLYQSLINQSNHNFQWLVVDDGSTDSTSVFFNQLISKKSKFSIKYIYKSNGGKASAINTAMSHIEGDIVTIVDSDDYLLPNAVDEILIFWKKYYPDSNIGGITFQKGLTSNKGLDMSIVGEEISTLQYKLNHGYQGDHFETVRTDLMRQFKFPLFKNEKFIGEAAMWYLITKNYKTVYVDKVLYICEYLDGGLSKSGRRLRIENPYGGRWHAQVFMNKGFNFKIRLKNTILYDTYTYFIRQKYGYVVQNLNSGKALTKICLVPSFLLYKLWSKKYEK